MMTDKIKDHKVRKIMSGFSTSKVILSVVLTVVLHSICVSESLAATLTLHPSGSAAGDNISYTGGTAATALDSNDGNTSYGTSTGSGNDYYLEMDEHTTESGSINSVIVKAVVRKSSSMGGGGIEFIIGVKTNGSSYFSSTKSHSSTTYTMYSGDTYTTNPQSSSAWTWSEIDSLVAIVDHTDSDDMRVTELYVEVDYTPCTDPDPSTITIPGSQTASSDPYDVSSMFSTTGDVGSFEYKVTEPGTPTSTDWGITTSLGSSTNVNWTRAVGGTSPNTDGMKLRSVSVYVSGTHNSQIRVAVYSGGDLASGPDGATLLWDAGQTSGSATNQWLTLTYSGPDITIQKNTPLWVAVKGNDNNFAVAYSGSSGDAGDFQTARGRFVSGGQVSSSETTSYPDTWPSDSGSFSNYWYSFYLNYEVGGVTVCTDWTSNSSIPSSTAGGTSCGDYSDGGTYTLDVRGTDPDCGDSVTATATDFTWNADSTAPIAGTATPSNTDYNNQYVDSPFDLSTTFTDNESAVTSCEYTTNGSTWTSATVSGSGPYTCTKTGITASDGALLTLNMRATSGGGTTTATVVNRTVDDVAPTTTDDYPGGTITYDPIITLSPTDARSGVADTVYCVDQFNSCSPSTSGTSVPVTGTPGVISTWYVRYYSADNVGNTESVNSTTVTIDHTCSPAVTITGFNPSEGVAGTTSVTIDGSGFEASRGSGSVQFNVTNVTAYTSWNATQIVVTVPAGATTGAITVQNNSGCSETTGSNFGVCTRSDPSITFIPSSASIKKSENQVYTVRITNNDQYCPDSNFSYSLVNETGDTSSFVLPSAFTDGSTGSLADGATYDTSLTVTADAAAVTGNQLTSAIRIDADGVHSQVDNSVTTSIAPDWSDNSMLLHNANRFGDCTDNAYDGTSQSDCEGAGGTWSPTSKWSGNWGLEGGKYGGIMCESCHIDSTTNIKRIMTSITAPDTGDSFPGQTGGKTISLLNASTDFGDQNSNSWYVCEYCHSTTAVHKYNVLASHNGQGDCIDCHTHKAGFVGKKCTECHNAAQGAGNVRRQIVGSSGDFDRAQSSLHHIQVSQANINYESCQVCHDNSQHKNQPGGDPAVLVYNQDTGAAIQYSSNGAVLEIFCASCHDSDGSTQNGTQPFSGSGDTNSPPDIGWTAGVVSHSSLSDVCFDCHGDSGGTGSTTSPIINAHASDTVHLLRYSYTDGASHNFCYNCHNGLLASTDIQSEFAKTYNHGAADCLGCHNQHMAEPGTHTPAGQWYPSSPSALTNNVSGVISGVTGIEPDTEPGWDVPASYTTINEALYEYQICFKCHSDWSGSPPTGTTNQAKEFSRGNKSVHPVRFGLNSQTGSYSPKALTASQMSSPWNSNLGTQTMYCSDCHGADNEVSGDPKGPHGSNSRFMLKGPYKYWPLRNDAQLWKLSDKNSFTSYGGLFCRNCHPIYDGSWKNNVHSVSMGMGGGHRDMTCVECHVAVPHGSKRSRFIGYGANATNPDPAPYDYNGNSLKVTGFKKAATPTSYVGKGMGDKNCATAGTSGCHGSSISSPDP